MAVAALIVLLILLVLGVPVAATLVALALYLDVSFSTFPLHRGMAEVLWSSAASFLLIAIPMFILLGEILVRAGIAARAYEALDRWLAWLPGGLIHANIGTATLFSATSGSSVATAATIGRVAMPQAGRLGYDPKLFAGAIAAGGTLGIMIPPSINLIIYGFLADTSIPRLFLAGLVPGLLLAGLFMLVTAMLCWRFPSLGGPSRAATWRQRLRSLVHLLPLLALFAVIVGTIYLGLATPTEAASVGVLLALIMAGANGSLTLPMLRDALMGTMRTTAMIMLIIMAAYFLNYVIASTGLAADIANSIEAAGLGPMGTLLLIVVLYILLGFFIETLSLMVITIPLVAPVAFELGFDPVWFGVLLILLIEMALITPPVGLNLYVVQGVREEGNLNQVMLGALPYVLMMLVMAALLMAFPQIALFLPTTLN